MVKHDWASVSELFDCWRQSQSELTGLKACADKFDEDSTMYGRIKQDLARIQCVNDHCKHWQRVESGLIQLGHVLRAVEERYSERYGLEQDVIRILDELVHSEATQNEGGTGELVTELGMIEHQLGASRPSKAIELASDVRWRGLVSAVTAASEWFVISHSICYYLADSSQQRFRLPPHCQERPSPKHSSHFRFNRI